MYVSLCNGYRNCELKALAQQGVRSAHAAFHTLGAGPRCGRCLSIAQRVIGEHNTLAAPLGPLAVSARLSL